MRQTYYFLSFVLLLFVFISCSDDVVGKGTDTIGLETKEVFFLLAPLVSVPQSILTKSPIERNKWATAGVVGNCFISDQLYDTPLYPEGFS